MSPRSRSSSCPARPWLEGASLPSGHASAIDALGMPSAPPMRSRDGLRIVGGVDSYSTRARSRGWTGTAGSPRKRIAAGFAPGEAAAFVAVASDRRRRTLALPSRRRRRARPCRASRKSSTECALLGSATGSRGPSARSPRVSRTACACDDVYCDINGERYRAERVGFRRSSLAGAAFGKGGVYRTAVARAGRRRSWRPGACWRAFWPSQAWQRGYASGPRRWSGPAPRGLRAAVLLDYRGRLTRMPNGRRQPAQDARDRGQQRHRRRDASQRLQDAGPAGAVRSRAAAEHRQERHVAPRVLARRSRLKATAVAIAGGELRQHGRRRVARDRRRASSRANVRGPHQVLGPGRSTSRSRERTSSFSATRCSTTAGRPEAPPTPRP